MRFWSRALLGLTLLVGCSEPGYAATDLAAMQPPEIEALQKRLTDGGCYTGPIDGQASPATADAEKACPSQSPGLLIETGMHIAGISRIGVDAEPGEHIGDLRWRLVHEGLVMHAIALARPALLERQHLRSRFEPAVDRPLELIARFSDEHIENVDPFFAAKLGARMHDIDAIAVQANEARLGKHRLDER